MKCRYCSVYRKMPLVRISPTKHAVDRFCDHAGEEVTGDSLIYAMKKNSEGQKVRKYCEGFILHEMIYCEQHMWISIHGKTSGCLARQSNPEEYPDCKKCKLKHILQELVKVDFILRRKRRKPLVKC